MNIEEKVKEIIADQFEINTENIKLTDRLVENFGADSLSVIELVVDIEEVFNISIPDEAFKTIKTVGDVVTLVINKQSAINLSPWMRK